MMDPRRLSAALLSALGLAAAVAALFWTWFGVVHAFRYTGSARAVDARPNAIVWADRVFGSRPAFARWLGERGHTYPAWERLHPAAGDVLRP
jgi:hypothetical protein